MAEYEGVIAALRECWRRIDRLERAARDNAVSLAQGREHGDSNFSYGRASGFQGAKDAVMAVASEILKASGRPVPQPGRSTITNANER